MNENLNSTDAEDLQNIIQGDCLDVMRTYPDNYFSGIVCDPPYMIGFMGKAFDKFKDNPAANVELWKEALRICKPGSHLLAFGGDRTHHHMMKAIEDAGWEIRTCLYWCFGSGFPKSHNFGKKIGGDWQGYGTALKPAVEIIVMAIKPLEGTFAQNAEKWGVAGINIDASRIESGPVTIGLSKAHLGNNYGRGVGGRGTSESYINSQGRWPANLLLDEEAAQQLDEMTGVSKSSPYKTKGTGSIGFHHCLGRGSKPREDETNYNDSGGASRFFYCAKASSRERNEGCEGFWFDNLELVLHNGTSFELEELWVLGDQNQVTSLDLEASQKKDTSVTTTWCLEDKECTTIWSGNENEGQFPMVIRYITSTGSKQTIELKTWNFYQHLSTNECIQDVIKTNEETGISLAENVGLRSILKRIFTKEKMASLRGVKNAQKKMPYLISVKEEMQRRNFHSTVKPLKLMQYLLRLIAPPSGGIILDPFAGSGSTVVAAKHLGIECIGIEKSAEYCEIARARIA